MVAIRPDAAGRLCNRYVLVCLARCGYRYDRRYLPQRTGISLRHPIPGRRVAREDSLVSAAALLREWIPIWAASMDLFRRDQLGDSGDRRNIAGKTLTAI